MKAYEIKMNDGAEFTLIAANVQDARCKAPIVNGGGKTSKGYCVRAVPVIKDASFPEDYESLNWCVKLSILDPIRLSIWQSQNAPRIIPNRERAREIGLVDNWQSYLEA